MHAALILAAALAPTAPHYRVNATLDPDRGSLSATVEITVPADRAGQGAGFLLGRSYKVSSVSAGANATASVTDVDAPFPAQRLFVRSNGGKATVLRFTYAGPLSPTGEPPIAAISPQRIELSADALWYGLPENFTTRFTLDATIKGVPRGFVVATPDRVSRTSDGFILRRTKPEPDIAFMAAPGLHRVTSGDLQFAGKDLSTPQARAYQVNGAKALTFLEAWLGPLPTGKAVIAIAERRNGTGYSRPGYLVVADIGGDQSANLWGRYGYVAHELSHSWWSNADFTREDYWLVESTAEYVALRFMEKELGAEAIAPILARKAPRAARGGSILGHGRPSDDAVYAKGPLLLFDLEKTIGRPALDKILASLAQRESITTADFLHELAEVGGASTATAFEARLRS